MRRHQLSRTIVCTLVLIPGLSGCAALPLVAGSLLDAGGGVLVKTGTEYTASGAVYRTFQMPAEDLHAAVLATMERAQIPVTRDEGPAERRRIAGSARHRDVRVELLALTPALTSMEVVAKRNLFASDKATASEIIAQTAHFVAERSALASAGESPRPAPARLAARSKR